MTTVVEPICLTCRYLHLDDDIRLTCDAFPDGIPFTIITGEANHRLPIDGDNGIRYKPLIDSEPDKEKNNGAN